MQNTSYRQLQNLSLTILIVWINSKSKIQTAVIQVESEQSLKVPIGEVSYVIDHASTEYLYLKEEFLEQLEEVQ